MNNYEHIKNMNIDEMHTLLATPPFTCKHCAYETSNDCFSKSCNLGIKQWLESEVEE